MPIVYLRTFKRYNWSETVESVRGTQIGFSDNLNSWLDTFSGGFIELYVFASDNINSFDDVLDGFVEDLAWNDSISAVTTP